MELLEHILGNCGETHLNIYTLFLFVIIIYLSKKKIITNGK